MYKVWDMVTTYICHRSSYDIIFSIIYLIYTRHIPNEKGIYLVYVWYISVISHLSPSHTKYKGRGLLPLHQVTLSAEKSLLQHRAVWTKRKQRWKYTGFEYQVQAYGMCPLTGPWPEPAWHQPGKSTGGRRIPSFYRPCPLFKHQRHWNTNGTFRFFKFKI